MDAFTPQGSPAPDLDKLRDEKCIPLARAVLNDMAIMLVPENANEKVDYNPLLKKILERTLEADTNIVMENPYIFQLMLGAMAGLNATVQLCAMSPIDDIRYGAIGKKIMGILATANVPLVAMKDPKKGVDPKVIEADFAPVKEQIEALFAEEKLNIMEVKYVMDNLFESFSDVQTIFMASVGQSSEKAEAKLFGLQDITDLSMKKLDEVLTAPSTGGSD